MKKLIINEKNLPKINKAPDSNIRIRINKGSNAPQNAPIKKSIPTQIQEIDSCVETLQKAIAHSVQLDQQKIVLVLQLLKQFKEILTPSVQLLTQSLKFSKLKFKTIVEEDDKQNNGPLPKQQKNIKDLSSSDRLSRLAQRSPSLVTKNQKGKKLVSMHKKSPEEKCEKQDATKKASENAVEKAKQEDQLAESQYISDNLKIEQHAQLNTFEQPSIKNRQESILQSKVKDLEKQVSSLSKSLQDKNQEIQQLHERIQQLTINIENLIKKNSQKSEDFNKLHEENLVLLEKINTISAVSPVSDEQNLKKCERLEQEKSQIQKKKTQLEKQIKVLEREKKEKLDQEVGRYETAQKFYELTRRDLKEENENLLNLLEERQTELRNLYQVISFKESLTCSVRVSDFQGVQMLTV